MPVVPGLTDLRVFARGGYATVYRATQISVGREVAVKIENRTLDSERDQQRFVREARAAGRMSSHPHVVDLFDAGMTADGHPYLIMEMCDGSYAERMRHSPLGAAETRNVGVKIADALADAHHLGVLHRDVKPANILYSRFNEAVLADFGLAVLAEARDSTVTLEVLTPAYAPPEMFKHEPPSPAVDVYALCATLYAVMHGKPPRWRADLNPSLITLMELFNEPIPDLPGIPSTLLDVLRQGMMNDPSRRPTAERLRDLLAAVPLNPPEGFPPGAATRPHHPAFSTAAPPASAGTAPVAGSGAGSVAGGVGFGPAIGSGATAADAWSPAADPWAGGEGRPAGRAGSPWSSGPATPDDDHPTVRIAIGGNRPNRGRRLLAGLGVLVLLVGVAAGTWYLFRPDVPGSPGGVVVGSSAPPAPTTTPTAATPSAPATSVTAGGALPGCLAPLPGGGRCPAELECFEPVRVSGGTARADRVPCAGRHTWEAYAVGDLPAEVDSADHQAVKADPTVRQVCSQHSFRSTTSLMSTTGWHFEVLPPTAESVAAGDRSFRCLAGQGVNRLSGPTLAG